jgi:probable rRNA maturation factor
VRVAVSVQVKDPGISATRLRSIVRHVMRREGAPKKSEISVALVNDPAIRWLNRRHLGKDRATDVLAFPLHEAAKTGRKIPRVGRRDQIGEVVISVDRARIQAGDAGHRVRTEVALLATHGVLHLLGYDDHSRRGTERMMRRARTLLAEAGEKVKG